jgi:hypothetical protein
MEVFRERTETPQTSEIEPQAPLPVKSDTLAGYENKATDDLTTDEKQIEIWEGLNRTKYINDYFDIKAYEGEFNLKMQTSQINKYITAELENRKWDKNVDNWAKLMGEIETEIGSREMSVFDRITKITNYIRVLNKLNSAKKLKESYSI